MNESELSEVFQRLGARNPEAWARSQIPQLARFIFLRQAWHSVVGEGDVSWISKADQIDPNGPGGGIRPALSRLLSKGAQQDDLTTVVRVMQWRVLSRLCYLLDGPAVPESAAKEISWRLFQVDEDERPIAPIGGLHESVLETEPSGREMRPK
jgi:hypothetical protein